MSAHADTVRYTRRVRIGQAEVMRQVDFVVVSGPPGSGKSTLASGLAAQLGLPLLGKDIIKEALMDSLGASTIDESRRIGGASISVLFALARANGCGVLESNWSAALATESLRGLGGRLIEAFCDLDPVESHRRYLERAPSRHPGHFDQDRGDDRSLWHGPASRPIAGGWPVIRVDTSSPVAIDSLVRDLLISAQSIA